MGKMLEPSFWEQSPPPQTGDMNAARTLNQRAIRELPGALPPEDVVIQDGKISGFASAALIVDTEGGAAADDLDVINIVLSANENLHPGMLITLRAKDPARVVTVKNSAAANGINTADGNDIVLSPDWELTLRLVGGKWYEVRGRSSAQVEEAQADATTALERTVPATTTARGIGRVATAADALPGSTITNGPAFLDASTVKITPTPTANAVVQADADGKIDAYLSLNAKVDFSNVDLTKANIVLQQNVYETGDVATGTTAIPNDNTIPQQSEGDQYMAVSITPKRAASRLVVDVIFSCAVSDGYRPSVALFRDSKADAIAAMTVSLPGPNNATILTFTHSEQSTSVNKTTFKVRAGSQSGSRLTFNGTDSVRHLGGACKSSIIVTEYAV